MHVLIVSNSLPFPPHDGSRVILFNLLKHLSSSITVDLLTLLDPNHSYNDIQNIAPFCNTLTTLPAQSPAPFSKKIAFNLSSKPYNVVSRYNHRMARSLSLMLRRTNYDALIFYGVSSSLYGTAIDSIPKIAYEIDAGSLYFVRNFFRDPSLYRKVFYLLEHIKYRRYERMIYPQFDKCIVVSQTDKRALKKICPSAKIEVIPNGIDTNFFRPTHREIHPSLLFTGNMDYPPNIHGALWFYHKVLPRIVARFPQVTFNLVGKNPIRHLTSLKADSKVNITGFVPDIRPWFDKASLYICPMVSGTGLKNKLLEAMAMEKAIVSTSLGLDGISEPTDFVLRADNPNDFSNSVLNALEDSNMRNHLGKMGRAFVLNNHGWRSSADRFERILVDICRTFN